MSREADLSELVGSWEVLPIQFDVELLDGALVARFPGVDPAFHGVLRPRPGGEVTMAGGPFAGASLCRADGAWTVGGYLPMIPLDRPASAPPGGWLPAPPRDRTEDEHWAARWRSASPGKELALEAGEIGPFVQWAMDQESFIFHGSNDPMIDELIPRRTSLELMNHSGRGNLGAVYGTHDGLQSLWFSVVDRGRIPGTIRSGVERFQAPDGGHVDLYYFSVGADVLPDRPFTTGALYLLPRDPFEQLPAFPGGPPSAEWVSTVAVRPLARLTVPPEAFPFIDAVGGHDDGPILEMSRLADEVYGSVSSARAIDGGIEIVTSAPRATVEHLVDLSAAFYPDISRVVSPHPDGVAIVMRGPAAFVHSIRERFADVLDS